MTVIGAVKLWPRGQSLAMSIQLPDINGAMLLFLHACKVLKLDLNSAFYLFADTTPNVRHEDRQAS